MSVAIHPVKQQDAQYARVAMLGLAGVCVVCVTQILTLSKLDLCLELALGSFSLGLPVLTTAGLMQEGLLERSSITSPAFSIAGGTLLVGSLFAVSGLTFLFWHFHWVFGSLFLVSSSSCVIAMLRLHANLDLKELPPDAKEI
jgi:hypothetical protein